MTNIEIPKQFKDQFGMGTAAAVYPAKERRILRIIAILVLLAVAAATAVSAVGIFMERWGRYYPPVILKAVLPDVVVCLGALLLVLLILWGFFTSSKKAGVIYQNGFAYSTFKGVQSWKWENVRDITSSVLRQYTNGVYSGTIHIYILVNSQGEKIKLDDSLKDVEKMYDQIHKNSFPYRYERLANAYNSGKNVNFGTVSLSKTVGIQIGKKTYPWNEIEEVAIQNGMLSVKKKDGRWFSGAKSAVSLIPNLFVLLSIIDQMVGIKAGK